MRMKVYITAHALTHGIQAREAEVSPDSSGICLTNKEGKPTVWYYERGKEWHTDLASAQQEAERMRLSMIARLKEQIARLETLTWEPRLSGQKNG